MVASMARVKRKRRLIRIASMGEEDNWRAGREAAVEYTKKKTKITSGLRVQLAVGVN